MKTDELTDVQLDYWVAKALGKKYVSIGLAGVCWAGANHQDQDGGFFAPSTSWSDGGPILERKRISLVTVTVNWGSAPPVWRANVLGKPAPYAFGRTMLEAGMRALVKSEFGDEV
jgi:hypothetical protein